MGWPNLRENFSNFTLGSWAWYVRMISSVLSGEGSMLKMISKFLVIESRIGTIRRKNSGIFFSSLYTGTMIDISIFSGSNPVSFGLASGQTANAMQSQSGVFASLLFLPEHQI